MSKNINNKPNKQTVENIPEYKEKMKPNTKTTRKRQRAVKALADGKGIAIKTETLVSSSASSLNSCDIANITTLNKRKRKDIVETGSSKVTEKEGTKGTIEHDIKNKHKENLQTILVFSNATPFKNKTPLGFVCVYCDATYPDPVDLTTHTETVHKSEHLLLKSRFGLDYFSVNLNVIDLICKICDEKMDDLTVLKEHLVKVHERTIHYDIQDHIIQFKLYKGDIYNCAMCSYTTYTFRVLKQHMNKHYSNYACKNCDATFVKKRLLDIHSSIHLPKNIKCNYCDKTFNSTMRRNSHEKVFHLGGRKVGNCEHCNMPLNSHEQKLRHLVKEHNCEMMYKCNLCNKAFILKSQLKAHAKKVHFKERNHQCMECGSKFFSASLMKCHMLKHTGEKNFICDICDVAFTTKQSLIKHTRSFHSNDGNGGAKKTETVVSSSATSLNSCDIANISTLNKRERKDIVETGSSKITEKEGTNGTIEHDIRKKHKDNLQTILKLSNATPFKDKTPFGFICGYCDATYPDPVDLRTHTETVHKSERLLFKSKFDLRDYSPNLNIIDLICKVCDEKMDDLTVLKEHLVKIHKRMIHYDIQDHILQFKLYKGDIYNCAMCSYTTSTFRLLKQHMNKHYSNYACENCDATFVKKRLLDIHSTIHLPKNVKCNYCDKTFTCKLRRNDHERINHLGGRKAANCELCNMSFNNFNQKLVHLVKVHNCEMRNKCNLCNKAFILKAELTAHTNKVHFRERKHQCMECGARFYSVSHLRVHIVKHTKEKKFICDICNIACARKQALVKHLRRHSDEKRYKCHLCGMTFAQKCSIKCHFLSKHSMFVYSNDIVSC